jgi:hypothetical protein
MKKILLLLMFLPTFAIAQKNCGYKIDTTKVLNRNLKKLGQTLQPLKLTTKKSRKDIPKFIMKTLDCLTEGFSLADPNELFQNSDTYTGEKLPMRQITYIGLGKEYFVMAYNKGGRGLYHHLMIIKFKGQKITDFWTGAGDDLKTKNEIVAYLLKTDVPASIQHISL